jgi:hypothetical protein
MTDDEAMRYALLMRAFEMSDNSSVALTLAENMRRFVYGLEHSVPIQAGDLTASIKSVLQDFEGPVQGFNSVAIPGKVDGDYEIGEGGRRRSTRDRTRRHWTDAEVAEVKQYIADGFSLDDIAEAIGRSWMAVEKALRDGRFV